MFQWNIRNRFTKNAKITAAPTGTAVISYSQKKINNIDLSDTFIV